MGSTESTGRSTNGTTEEEERIQENDGGSMGSGTAVAIAAAGTVMAAWGISRMISSSSNSEDKEKDDDDLMIKIKARGAESSNSANFLIRESMQLEGKRTGPKSIWSPPPVGRFKMNTDGGCPNKFIEGDGVERGLAGYAGILRDDRGMWVGGFQGSFDGLTTDCLTAEFHGIHNGLKLLDKLKLKGSILESDCKAAVDWVNGEGDNRHKRTIIYGCWDMIEESRQLKLKNNIAVVHIIGENANQCAHKLADIAAKKQGPYVEIRDLPPEITHLVVKDNKFSYNR